MHLKHQNYVIVEAISFKFSYFLKPLFFIEAYSLVVGLLYSQIYVE